MPNPGMPLGYLGVLRVSCIVRELRLDLALRGDFSKGYGMGLACDMSPACERSISYPLSKTNLCDGYFRWVNDSLNIVTFYLINVNKI